jgi:hypothetical protein
MVNPTEEYCIVNKNDVVNPYYWHRKKTLPPTIEYKKIWYKTVHIV